MNPVFLYYLTLSVQQDPVIYPTQSTKKVRLLFRSLYIFTFNGSFKGGEVWVFWYYLAAWKQQANFLLLKVRPYYAVSFHFRKFAFLVYFDAQMEAVDCEILFAKIRGRKTNFSRPFQPCFKIFRERGKVYPNKSYL